MRAHRRTPALLFFFVTACASSGGPSNAEPAEQTRAVIENRTNTDMDIYVRRTDRQVIRLGFAPGGETTVFALPTALTAGGSSIRFEARPIRTGGQRVLSEPFPIVRGEEIIWSIPPQ
jgi:hypothetical protein